MGYRDLLARIEPTVDSSDYDYLTGAIDLREYEKQINLERRAHGLAHVRLTERRRRDAEKRTS